MRPNAIESSSNVDIENTNIFWNRFSSRGERVIGSQMNLMEFQWNPLAGDAKIKGFLELLCIIH